MRKRKLKRLLAERRGYADALRERVAQLENELMEERSIGVELEAQRDELVTRWRAPSSSDMSTGFVGEPIPWMEAETPEEAREAPSSPPPPKRWVPLGPQSPPEFRRVAPGDTIWLADREDGPLHRVVVREVDLSADFTLARLGLSPQ